jgi:uncharacterized membrane-anchored protein YjiN (DUF445 family)
MQHVLLDTNSTSQRLAEFIVKFVSAHGAGEASFNERVLRWLLKFTEAKSNAVRQRACQLVSGLMASLSDDAELDEALCAQIVKSMLVRTADR